MAQRITNRHKQVMRFFAKTILVFLGLAPTLTAQSQHRSKSNAPSSAAGLSSLSTSADTSRVQVKGTLNASQLYLQAREYFAAGRYAEAIQYAAASQRRSKDIKLQSILMAQSYYRMGNAPRAAKLFLSWNLSDVPQEAAVDYVLTMYAVGRHRDVIKGYGRVSDQHPYKDVTRFYAGVSLLNLRLYQKAQKMLRAARRLPANLMSQRRRLLSEIDDILENERRGVFDQSRAYSYQYQPSYLPPPVEPFAPQSPGVPGARPVVQPPAKAAVAPPAKESLTAYAKPSLALNRTSMKRDYHGYSQEESDDLRPSATLVLGLKYLGRPRLFGAQPSLDVSATPSYEDIARRSSSSSLQADESDPTNIRNVTTKSEANGYSLSQKLSASGLYPVSDPVDIVAGFDQKEATTKGSVGTSKVATITTLIKFVAEVDLFKLDAGLTTENHKDKLDSSNNESVSTSKISIARNGENTTTTAAITLVNFTKPILNSGAKSSQSVEASWLRDFDDFSLNLSANKTDKIRASSAIDYSNQLFLSQLSAKIEGAYNMTFGISAAASAGLAQYGSFIVRNDGSVIDGADEAKGRGSGRQLRLTLRVSPLAFVAFSTSYDYQTRALAVGDKAFEKTMMKDFWSLQTSTTLNVSVNYSF